MSAPFKYLSMRASTDYIWFKNIIIIELNTLLLRFVELAVLVYTFFHSTGKPSNPL